MKQARSSNNTVVKHSSRHPKFDGANTAITGRDIMVKKSFMKQARSRSTVVKLSFHHPKFDGLNPATIGREIMARKVL